LERIGFTRDVLGTTAHGMRHDRLQREFKSVAGVEAPIKSSKANGPDAPNWKTVADITQEAADRAQFKVAHLAGHNRKSSASAYLGSVAVARRNALGSSRLPTESGPHEDVGTLNERMAAMAAGAKANLTATDIFNQGLKGDGAD